jgi:hypothetical protein
MLRLEMKWLLHTAEKKKTIAVIIPYEKWKKSQKSPKRQLGALEGRMTVRFAADFSMTDEELIKL